MPPHPQSDITKKIKQKALQLGFDKIGVAAAEKLDGSFLQDWLKKGFNAGMSWMEWKSDLRVDVSSYFPGTRSVISVALSYYSDEVQDEKPEETGQVARYAVGKDYHYVIPEMLEELLQFIKKLLPQAKGKVVVDTAPVLDKVWAAKAGVGWIGKHSNVIVKDLGSYVFLGEILLTEELEADEPIADHCGTCTLCIDECPTQAIVEDYVVDSNKCISYRTIEHRGEFPKEWSGDNEDWVFGCDVCQEVCPWNKFSEETKIEEFKPRYGVRFMSLEEIENMGQEQFSIKFKGSPLKRAKLQGMKRNAKSVSKFHSDRKK